MKFTEEQFKQLVKIQEKYFSHNMLENGLGGGSPCQAIHESDIKMSDFIWTENLENEAVAIMNPVTREWAHEQFVEEEKRYAWTLKKVDKSGIRMRLYKEYFGRVQPFFSVTNVNIDDNEKLTETEIREWGYNPEMFDKEEVK